MLRAALEAQAPPKQNATDTITTLSDRLNNSTLLEDRRSAILGLRSFAREYPASVASTSLRGLIASLTRDVEDVDTGKVILETLLNLFNPDESSPEASDDIALWLADIFSQRQDNITVLLDLLDQPDFYSRLYSLQLLTAISNARPERTQECILSAPLGTSRLVAVLDDAREPVRSAGLVLLIEVTQASTELQKLVAFEGAFESIFELIRSEGSLALGGIVVQDCLTLLANLVHLNPSNQNSFRESGFVPRLGQLLDEEEKADEDADDLGPDPLKAKNLWGFLAVLRMFLVQGTQGSKENQLAFVRHGLLQRVLDLAFDARVELRIRAEALKTCGDIIRGNAPIQESFGSNKVVMHAVANGDGAGRANGATEAYVIDALLDLTLTAASVSFFDVRFAACEVVQAYFHNHKTIRLHFIDRAIYGFTSGEDETSNILSVLMGGPSAYESPDPYRIWFAALLTFRLTYEEPEAKSRLRGVSEGDAEQGEEVVTCIQSMTGNLISAWQAKEDGRIITGYLMLLSTWLYEDAESINDLLAEGSTVQSLIQAVVNPDRNREVEQGLIAFLLGILYEYSTKDSPIPRRKLQPLLLNGLGKENLTQRVSKLRQSHLLREFEVTPQDLSSAEPGLLPEVFFDQIFVEFFKDNYSRVVRSLDKDPGVETVRPVDGIDRDLVDNLRAQIAEKAEAHQRAESEGFEIKQRLEHAQAELRRFEERLNSERGTMKTINEKLHSDHDAELGSIKLAHGKDIAKIQEQHKKELQQALANSQQELKDARAKFDREMVDIRTRLGKEISDARSKPEKELKDVRNELRDMRTKHELDLRDAKAKADTALAELRARAEKAETDLAAMREAQAKHEQTLKDASAKVQKDLDQARAQHEQALKSAVGTHQSELIEAQASHEKELTDAKVRHDKELKEVHAKHEKTTSDTRAAVTKEVSEKHDKELASIRAKLEKAEADLKEAEKGNKKLSDTSSKLEKAETSLKEVQTKHAKELKDAKNTHDKALESATSKAADTEKELKTLQETHAKVGKELTASRKETEEAKKKAVAADSSKELKTLTETKTKLEKELAAARKDAEDAKKKASQVESATAGAKKQETELADLRKRIADLEAEAAKAAKDTEQLRTLNSLTLEKVKDRDSKIKTLEETRIKTLEESKHAIKGNRPSSKSDSARMKMLEKEAKEQELLAKGLQESLEGMKKAVEEKEELRQSAKTELDDLLLVLGDLEEKRARDKKRLKDLGEKTSDDEEEEDDDDEDEEDDDEEEEEDEDDANGPRDSDVD